jgi:hypothetical protein
MAPTDVNVWGNSAGQMPQPPGTIPDFAQALIYVGEFGVGQTEAPGCWSPARTRASSSGATVLRTAGVHPRSAWKRSPHARQPYDQVGFFGVCFRCPGSRTMQAAWERRKFDTRLARGSRLLRLPHEPIFFAGLPDFSLRAGLS